jgi:RNA polymerase sigma factor (sigma-70 family)
MTQMQTKTPPPFAAFLEEHRTVVYRYLLATVGPHAADDCFQETFLSALRAYPRLSHADNLRSWVLTIATRKAMDHHRKTRRTVAMAEVPETVAPEAPDAQPEVWEAVAELPPTQRAAVVQRYVLDLSYAEVAEALGSSEEAARAAAYEGRKKLKLALEGSR